MPVMGSRCCDGDNLSQGAELGWVRRRRVTPAGRSAQEHSPHLRCEPQGNGASGANAASLPDAACGYGIVTSSAYPGCDAASCAPP